MVDKYPHKLANLLGNPNYLRWIEDKIRKEEVIDITEVVDPLGEVTEEFMEFFEDSEVENVRIIAVRKDMPLLQICQALGYDDEHPFKWANKDIASILALGFPVNKWTVCMSLYAERKELLIKVGDYNVFDVFVLIHEFQS